MKAKRSSVAALFLLCATVAANATTYSLTVLPCCDLGINSTGETVGGISGSAAIWNGTTTIVLNNLSGYQSWGAGDQ